MSKKQHVRSAGECQFQSTSSEEDVVSLPTPVNVIQLSRFNPRPPKRTLCPPQPAVLDTTDPVSIHVLRRGRCVVVISVLINFKTCFNPRPPKRTLCL